MYEVGGGGAKDGRERELAPATESRVEGEEVEVVAAAAGTRH